MSGSGFLRRFLALLRKEVRQMLRDKSNMAVGLLLPAALILLFGYGLSFDVKHAPLAVVMEDASPGAREAVQGLGHGLRRRPSANMPEAEARLRAGEVDAIVRVPPDFSRRRRRRARAAGAERQQLHHRADAGRLCRRRHRPLVPAPGRARRRQAGRRRRRGGAAHVVQRGGHQHRYRCPACWCWC